MSQLQPTILSFFINCLSVATPLKSEIADLVSNGGLLNISPVSFNERLRCLATASRIVVVVVLLLLYVHGKHLRSWRDGQLT